MAEKLDATFFAVRKREKGGVLTGASIAYAAGFILLYAALIGVAWLTLGGGAFVSWYNEALAAQASGEVYEAAPPNPMGVLLLLPVAFVWVFLLFILFAAYEAACVRWMLRGDTSAPLQLHFGADMWRVYGTYWAWLIYVAITWVIFFVVMMAAGAVGANSGAMGGWVGLAITAAYLVAWFYTSVRLSPASATSIGVGEFAPLKAWRASKGRFWALFGSYFLLIIIYFVVVCFVSAIALGSFYSQVFGGLDWTMAQTNPEGFMREYEQASMRAMQQMFSNPASIALYVASQVLTFVIALMFYVLWFGVEARAVQAALEEGKIEKAAPAV